MTATSDSIAIWFPENAPTRSTVTQEEEGHYKSQWANGAWLSFQEETGKVKDHKHSCVLKDKS